MTLTLFTYRQRQDISTECVSLDVTQMLSTLHHHHPSLDKTSHAKITAFFLLYFFIIHDLLLTFFVLIPST